MDNITRYEKIILDAKNKWKMAKTESEKVRAATEWANAVRAYTGKSLPRSTHSPSNSPQNYPWEDPYLLKQMMLEEKHLSRMSDHVGNKFYQLPPRKRTPLEQFTIVNPISEISSDGRRYTRRTPSGNTIRVIKPPPPSLFQLNLKQFLKSINCGSDCLAGIISKKSKKFKNFKKSKKTKVKKHIK